MSPEESLSRLLGDWNGKNGTSFPAVPNLWLVTRSRREPDGTMNIEQQWIVESDYSLSGRRGNVIRQYRHSLFLRRKPPAPPLPGAQNKNSEAASMKCFRWVNVMARFDRLPIRGCLLSLLVVSNLQANDWQEISKNFNLAIYIRHRPDSAIEEVRGVGEFNATILVLKGVLADVGKYSEFMPYTKESRLLRPDTQVCYMLLKPPLVGSLDYTIRVHEELLKGADGGTIYHRVGILPIPMDLRRDPALLE